MAQSSCNDGGYVMKLDSSCWGSKDVVSAWMLICGDGFRYHGVHPKEFRI